MSKSYEVWVRAKAYREDPDFDGDYRVEIRESSNVGAEEHNIYVHENDVKDLKEVEENPLRDVLDGLSKGAVVAFGDHYDDQVVYERREGGEWAEASPYSAGFKTTQDLVDLWGGTEARVLSEGF